MARWAATFARPRRSGSDGAVAQAPAHGQAHLSGPDDDRVRGAVHIRAPLGLLDGSDARDQPRRVHREPIPIPRRALLMSRARLLTFEQDDLGGPPDAHPRFTCV